MPSFLISVFFVVLAMVLITLLIGYFMFRKQKKGSYRSVKLPDNAPFGLQVQLIAYERLVLFVERTYPPNFVEKYYSPDLSKEELRSLFVAQIVEEFNHNISQQVYVSTQVWEHLREYKDKNIMYLNLLAQSKETEDARIFVNNIISFYGEKEQRANYLLLLEALRFEVRVGLLKV